MFYWYDDLSTVKVGFIAVLNNQTLENIVV